MSYKRYVLPLVLLAGSFALYLSTLAPGMLRGDSGEFQWAMASLNVAHATGYPLYTLLGYAWQLFPLSDNIAWQLNLLTAFFGACAVAALFVLVRSVTRSTPGALASALVFALTPVLWFNSSILEVYPLHAFLLTLLLYFFWRWSRAPQQSAFLYLGFFVLGLALAHHRLIILALPALLYFLLATDRRFFLNLPRLLVCALLVVPGLLLYAYVPMQLLPAGFTLDYALNDIILGREYAGSLLREINPLPVLLEIPWQNFSFSLVLAIVGAVALFRRARHLNVALWLIYLIDVAFALVYSVPDVNVFLISSFVVTAFWVGAGVAFILEFLAARLSPGVARYAVPAVSVVLVLLTLLGLLHYPAITSAVAAEAAPEPRARAILASNLPPGSFLELDWETATAIRFLQATEHTRTDLETRLIGVDKRVEFWRTLNNAAAGRPVLIESGVKWTRAPAGYGLAPAPNNLARLVIQKPTMQKVSGQVSDRVELVGYHSSPDAFTLYWRVKKSPGKALATYVHYLDAQGNKLAQDDRAACCEALYSYSTGQWEAGQTYADVFKPAPPGTVSYEVGMYENNNGDIEPYGEPVTIQP